MAGLLPPAAPASPVAIIDADRYLARIGYAGSRHPTFATLAALHLAHLRTVPFENFDIGRGVPIILDEAALVEKIVGRRRGGICYELNGAFAALLRWLGFTVALRAAVFPRPAGAPAPDYDHMTLVVTTPAGDGPWLADVGAGRGAPAQPLTFTLDAMQDDLITQTRFQLLAAPGGTRLRRQSRASGAAWEDDYLIAPGARSLRQFAPGLAYHQTDPASHFTQGSVCTRLTSTGRVTLAKRQLIVTSNGARHERTLGSDADVEAVLHDEFGLDRRSM